VKVWIVQTKRTVWRRSTPIANSKESAWRPSSAISCMVLLTTTSPRRQARTQSMGATASRKPCYNPTKRASTKLSSTKWTSRRLSKSRHWFLRQSSIRTSPPKPKTTSFTKVTGTTRDARSRNCTPSRRCVSIWWLGRLSIQVSFAITRQTDQISAKCLTLTLRELRGLVWRLLQSCF